MNTKVYPARITAINGSATGPFAPGPSSGFVYDVAATMDDRVRTFPGVSPPATSRWPDSVDMWPLAIDEPVFVYRVMDRVVLKDAEHVPYFQPCPGGAR